jgi:hypothetical protein
MIGSDSAALVDRSSRLCGFDQSNSSSVSTKIEKRRPNASGSAR